MNSGIKKLLLWVGCGAMAATVPGLWAQQVASTKIYASDSLARFRVDGQEYQASAVFLWQAGTKHIIEIDPVQLSSTGDVRLTFGGWADPKGLLSATSSTLQVLTADPSVPELKATITKEYGVYLNLFDNAGNATTPSSAPGACGAPSPTQTPAPGVPNSGIYLRPGLVYINGQCYWTSARLWLAGGTALNLNAQPYDGFVFAGWSTNLGVNNSFLRTYTVNGPVQIYARFEPAKRVKIYTEPPGLKVLVDRSEVTTLDPVREFALNVIPGQYATFDWADGSTHLLGSPVSQMDPLTGKMWIFDSFDIGGGQNTIYKVSGVSTPGKITAKYLPGATASFVTSPTNLKLSIDGRDNWPAYNFVWAVGSKHTVSAPANNTDSRGRKYVLKGWTSGGGAAQEVSVTEGGLRMIASYDMLNRLTISANLPGVRVQLDGADCALPCSVDRAAAAQVRVTPPAAIAATDTMHYDFASWSDGGPAERVITLTSELTQLSLNYQTSYKVRALTEPAEGGSVAILPAAADGFYPANTQLAVKADAAPGFKFRRWDGDLVGSFGGQTITVNSPLVFRAMWDRTPYIAPSGVRNAAGETPGDGVAPGSIVSIFGASLAAAYVAGPANPLAQAVGDVTVRVDGRFLPLVFVSPGQINAQLPSDLAEGEYSMTVRSSLAAEVIARFRVVRNAPGLFSTSSDGTAFAVAAHEDGSTVTKENPARRGETITIYGTGFGPGDRPAVDGFAAAVAPAVMMADPVDVVAGETLIKPFWTGLAPGTVGMVASKFKVPEDAITGPLTLKVRVQSAESNSVGLHIE